MMTGITGSIKTSTVAIDAAFERRAPMKICLTVIYHAELSGLEDVTPEELEEIKAGRGPIIERMTKNLDDTIDEVDREFDYRIDPPKTFWKC